MIESHHPTLRSPRGRARRALPSQRLGRGARTALGVGAAWLAAAGCASAPAEGDPACRDALDRLLLLAAWTAEAGAEGDAPGVPQVDWVRDAAALAVEACPPDEASIYACLAAAADADAMRACVRPASNEAWAANKPEETRGPGAQAAAPQTASGVTPSALALAKGGPEVAQASALAPPFERAAALARPETDVALASLGGVPADVLRTGWAPSTAFVRTATLAAVEAPAAAEVEPAPSEAALPAAAAAAAPSAPVAAPGAPVAPETDEAAADAPTDTAVAIAVQARRQAFHRCYAGVTQGLSEPPRVAYEVRLTLRGDGSVSEVDVASRRGDVPTLRACVQSVARRLAFEGRYRGEPDVRFPLVFSPGS